MVFEERKKMKKNIKIIASVLIVCAMILPLFSCAKDDTVMSIYMLKGPTGVGAVQLFENHDNYSITLVASPTVVSAEIIKGNYDVAALPINVAANLYQKTDKSFQIAAINTLSVLYIVTKDVSVTSLADLEGKTIYATGQGSTPEYIITSLLSAAGVTCNVEYSTDGTALATTIGTDDIQICLLPEPAATVAKISSGATIALDIAEEWEKYFPDTEIIQGCIIVRNGFAEEHPELLKEFLADYKASTEYVVSNLAGAAALCETHEIIAKAAIAKQAIPNCNIVYIDGEEMKTLANAFFTFLYEKAPASVGGEVPDEGIYRK